MNKLIESKQSFPNDYREGTIEQWYLDNRNIMGERLKRLNDQVNSEGEQSLDPEDLAFWLGTMVDELPEDFSGDKDIDFELFAEYEN